MASYLRPRRGKKATATSNNIVLKRGEVFFEVPDTGVGTGMGKIKMGDGTTAYGSLPYFNEAIDPSTITGIQNSITQLNNDLASKVENTTVNVSWNSGLSLYYYKTSLVGKQLCINAKISGLYMTQNQTVTIGIVSDVSSSSSVGNSGITISGVKYLVFLGGTAIKIFTPEAIGAEDTIYLNLCVVVD